MSTPPTTENTESLGRFDVTPTAAAPGDTLTITGRCVFHGVPAQLAVIRFYQVYGEPWDRSATEEPTPDGVFSILFRVPLDTPVDRQYKISLGCLIDDQVWNTTEAISFTLLAPGAQASTTVPAVVTTAAVSESSLPDTGTNAAPAVTGGLLALAVGAALVVTRVRRRHVR